MSFSFRSKTALLKDLAKHQEVSGFDFEVAF